jgi:hypothetical protein
VRITRLPWQGEDPSLLFLDKNIEKDLSKSTREKFHTHRGVCGLDIERICDPTVRFAAQVFSFKLLRKCRKHQVPARVIAKTEKCVKGIQMN